MKFNVIASDDDIATVIDASVLEAFSCDTDFEKELSLEDFIYVEMKNGRILY